MNQNVRLKGVPWRLPPGAPIPSVTLPSTEGDLVNLYDLAQTNPVVLFYYPGDGEGLRYPELSGCTAQACRFRDKVRSFLQLGVALFGVSLQSTERQREFATRENLTFPLLSDSREELAAALGLDIWVSEQGERFAARTTLIIARGGVIAHVFAPVQPEGHVEEVLAGVYLLGDS